MERPEIRTELPGPKAQEWLKKDKLFISQSYPRSYPAVIERGEGVWVWDVDGNKFLDVNAGIAVCAVGHCHPEVVAAIKEQAEKLIHISGTDFYYPYQVQIAEKLAEIVPGAQNKRAFLTNSGTEANEAAMKLARYKTRRPFFLAFTGAFHGRTYGTMSLSASKYVHKSHFGPFVPHVIHVPFPDPYRTPFGVKKEKVVDAVLSYIEDVVFHKLVDPEDVAAVFYEPIQGEGGYVVPPKDFYGKLKELTDRYGILTVVDEIQSGMGRTGRMFAIEHFNVIPDIVTIAKGIASGLPLGAMVAPRSLMDWEVGTHANTFGGNPIACMAALKTIEILEREAIENAEKMGEFLLGELKKVQERYPEVIGDVRGIGLMIGVDFVKDRETKEPDGKLRDKVVYEAFKRGLLMLGAGDSVIRWAPPLIITKEQLTVALEIFDEAIGAALG